MAVIKFEKDLEGLIFQLSKTIQNLANIPPSKLASQLVYYSDDTEKPMLFALLQISEQLSDIVLQVATENCKEVKANENK